MSPALSDYAGHFSRPAATVAADLEYFCAILQKWNRAQNLVSRETGADLWRRHVLDSVQLVRFIRSDDRHVVDLGSGGGFPALPLAVALKDSGVRFTLLEANSRKASFLRAAARDLQLSDVTVIAGRIEAVDAAALGPVDLVTSRALAPLPLLLGLAAPFFAQTTRAVFHKGRQHGEELREADASWDYDVIRSRSDIDPEAVLLEIRNLRRRR